MLERDGDGEEVMGRRCWGSDGEEVMESNHSATTSTLLMFKVEGCRSDKNCHLDIVVSGISQTSLE